MYWLVGKPRILHINEVLMLYTGEAIKGVIMKSLSFTVKYNGVEKTGLEPPPKVKKARNVKH